VTSVTAKLPGTLLENIRYEEGERLPWPMRKRRVPWEAEAGVSHTPIDDLIRRADDAIRESREQMEFFGQLRQRLHEILELNANTINLIMPLGYRSIRTFSEFRSGRTPHRN
jgi:hypothetical protein